MSFLGLAKFGKGVLTYTADYVGVGRGGALVLDCVVELHLS